MQEQPADSFFEEKEIHISQYIMVLMKRRMLIILVFVLCVCAALFYSFIADPIFESSAQLIIDKETSSSPITGERTDYENFHSQTLTFNTSMKMIRSVPVIKAVIRDLKLDREDKDLEVSFIQELVRQLKANIKLLLGSGGKDTLSPEEREAKKLQELIQQIREKITVEQVRDTRLLSVSIRDKDPELAVAMVNALAKKYMEFDLANKMESSKQTLEWLNNELYTLRKKLEDDEQKFFEYKQQNKVFSIQGKQKLTEQKLQEFNNKYLEARNRRLELDAKINELSRNLKGVKDVASVRSLINNPTIENIYAKIVELELEQTRMSKIYKSKHPKILQVKSELEKSRNRLAQEIGKERENLKSERKVLFAREKTLEKTITEFETDALDTSSKELKYTILQRNVNTSQNLYNLMVSRIKESNILQTSSSSNIRLVEVAQVPLGPVSPKKLRNLLLGMVLGLFLGCGLAFFFEYMDQTVRTEDDIREHFDLPVLAIIPKADKSVSYGANY